jgi:DNA-binding NarL/FixJ family response regulator
MQEPISTLVVDDEPDIRLLIRVLVQAANKGLQVVCEASSGQEALDLLEECEPVVVVLDQMMPGLTGIETAFLIRKRRPDQRLLLCTSYLTADLIKQAEAAGIGACLTKEQISRLPEEVLRLASAA